MIDPGLRKAAEETLEAHTQCLDGFVGMCEGCLLLWSRLVPYPCPSAVWAADVLIKEAADAAGPPA